MNLLALNLLLAAGWVALWGEFSGANLLLGLVVGYLVLYLTRSLQGETRYFDRLHGGIGLAVYFLYDLVVSSFRVAWDVITPPINARPGLITMPLEAKGDAAIMLTANLISLTPGTLSVDITDDRRSLIIHAMFAEDPDQVRRELKNGIERRIVEVFR